jgi:outer membrane protein assembly factor BamB
MYRQSAHENRSLLLVGHDKRLTAIHRDDGRVAWTFAAEHAYGYYVDFVAIAGRVYVAVGTSVVCLDYATGRVLGATQLERDVVRLFHDDGQLFALGDRQIACIDLAGRVRWSLPHEIQTQSTMATIGFPGNVVYGFRDSG